jgi:hypothetical protein
MSIQRRVTRLEQHIMPPPGRCRECADWPATQLAITGADEEWTALPAACPECGWAPGRFEREYTGIPASVL